MGTPAVDHLAGVVADVHRRVLAAPSIPAAVAPGAIEALVRDVAPKLPPDEVVAVARRVRQAAGRAGVVHEAERTSRWSVVVTTTLTRTEIVEADNAIDAKARAEATLDHIVATALHGERRTEATEVIRVDEQGRHRHHAHDPTWRNTLNTDLGTYGRQDVAKGAASDAGYPYYAWNGRVFLTETGAEACLEDELG